jgi:hypothetical protein
MTEVPHLPGTRMASGADRARADAEPRIRAPWVSWGVLSIAVAALPALAAAGCGGTEKPGAASAGKVAAKRSESMEHERCDISGSNVEALDTNGDGKPDIRRVYDGSKHEICRVVDLNHDGKTDLYEYFDASGAIRRREFCYDDTGDVNAVERYQGGKLVEREYDTTGQHRIDTWDWFDLNAPVDGRTGRPAHPTRRERDVRGGGVIDQWWAWNGDAVTISTDKRGDGKPDPASTIVLGGDGGGAPTAASSSPPPSDAPSTLDAGSPQSPAATSSEGCKP